MAFKSDKDLPIPEMRETRRRTGGLPAVVVEGGRASQFVLGLQPVQDHTMCSRRSPSELLKSSAAVSSHSREV